MGKSKERKRRFLEQYGICFLCGVSESTTIDHVPSRVCFDDRQWPEGFEFSACHECNQKISSIEQAVALLIRIADQTHTELCISEVRKLIQGVKNNTPELLPGEFATFREKRDRLKEIGYKLHYGEGVEDAPLFKMHPGWSQAFHAFSRKLLCAIYFKEVGVPLPQHALMRTEFFQFVDPSAPAVVQHLEAVLPNFYLGNRRNTSLGEQFMYRWGENQDEGFFAFIAQFRRSFFIIGVAINLTGKESSGLKGFISHKEEIELPI